VTLDIHDGDSSTAYALADAHVRDGEAAAATNFGAANVLETPPGRARRERRGLPQV
jgi:hypothetical protein